MADEKNAWGSLLKPFAKAAEVIAPETTAVVKKAVAVVPKVQEAIKTPQFLDAVQKVNTESAQKNMELAKSILNTSKAVGTDLSMRGLPVKFAAQELVASPSESEMIKGRQAAIDYEFSNKPWYDKVTEFGDVLSASTANFVLQGMKTIVTAPQATYDVLKQYHELASPISYISDNELKADKDIIGGFLKDAWNLYNDAQQNIYKREIQDKSSTLKNTYLLTQGVASLATAFALKSPTQAAGILTALGVSDDYNNAIDAGYNPAEALSITGLDAIQTYLWEKASLGILFSKVKTPFVRGIWNKVLGGIVGATGEATTEALQQGFSNTIAKMTYDDQRNILDGLWESFWVGGLVGGGAVAVANIADSMMNKQKEKFTQEIVDKTDASEADARNVIEAISGKLINNANEFNNLFKENRLIGLKGEESISGRPGIEQAAPLPIPKGQEGLYEEAKKYKTAEEFIANYKGSGTQYGEYNPSIRYGGTPGSKRLTELGVDTNKEITIYRGIDDVSGKLPRKISDGDFVTTDFDSARAYATSEKDVVSMKVKAKDLFVDDPDSFLSEPFYKGSEYIYSTKKATTPELTKSQLTDIWNKANLDKTTLKTDNMAYLGGKKKITPQDLFTRDENITQMMTEQSRLKEEAISLLTELDVAKEKLKGFSDTDVQNMREVKRLIKQNEAKDIEGLRKLNPKLVNKVLERVGEVKGMNNDAALDFIKEVPERGERMELRRFAQEMGRRAKEVGQNMDSYIAENFGREMLAKLGKLTPRNFKQTKEYKEFVQYAETIQNRDIGQPALGSTRHVSLTAKRIAEQLDGKMFGEIYNKMIQPVDDAVVAMTKEKNIIFNKIKDFKVIQDTTLSRDAFRYAEGKSKKVPLKAKAVAEYAREVYDDLLVRWNEARAKIGLEPVQRRNDYVTHIIEMNALMDIFRGADKISREANIKAIKKRLIDDGVAPEIAFERAKRQVEGASGIEMYIDAKQPVTKFAKERIVEEAKKEDIVSSLKAYVPAILRYIHQVENVTVNKALKDALPLNAKNAMRVWNTEQVAGINPSRSLNSAVSSVLSLLRSSLGNNIILGNIGTLGMQLLSFPQVVAMAGPKNFAIGLAVRLGDYMGLHNGKYEYSRTKALRSLNTDIGAGESILDEALKSIGRWEKSKNTTAHLRHGIQVGRNFLAGLMEAIDGVMVGVTFESFYNRGLRDKGLSPGDAFKWADEMTGKTQANYYKEALPPIMNTDIGKLATQFGTYGMNQFEMFKRDFGKEFIKDGDFKSTRNTRILLKHFFIFLAAAWVADEMAEKGMGREGGVYGVNKIVDDLLNEDLSGAVKDSTVAALKMLPFFSGIQYGMSTPVGQFFDTLINYASDDQSKVAKATDDLIYKWPWLLLAPAGGGQAKKTLEAVEANLSVDVPFIKYRSQTASGKKRFNINDWSDEIKSFIFGVYATESAQKYFDKQDSKKESELNLDNLNLDNLNLDNVNLDNLNLDGLNLDNLNL